MTSEALVRVARAVAKCPNATHECEHGAVIDALAEILKLVREQP